MKRYCLQLIALVGLGVSHGTAATVAFSPASTTAMAGDLFSVDVVISGLGNHMAPSVSAYDLTVSFDASVITATGVDFGLDLGDPAAFEALTSAVIAAGSVNLAAVSFLSPADLDALQSDGFRLVTLRFGARSAGVSPLRFEFGTVPGVLGLDIKDGFGALLEPATAENGIVSVTGIPEPGTSLLVLLPLAGILACAARRRS